MPKFTFETKESVERHTHEHPFSGKSPQWYSMFGGKCPVCDTEPEFEEVEYEKTKLGVRGLGDSSMSARRASRGKR